MVKSSTPLPKNAANQVLDLVGPEVDDDVRRLIGRYGPEAVKAAVGRQTRRKPGMKLKGDWLVLDRFLKSDAKRWLEGGDPFKEQTDFSIAKWFAENHRDRNVELESTLRRIKRKLSKDRRYYTLVEAFWLSRDDCSHQMHLKALNELCSASRSNKSWRAAFVAAEGILSDYRAKFGDPPANMTMRELEAAAAEALAADFAAQNSNILHNLIGSRPKFIAVK